MERALTHHLHAIIIGLVLYVLMVYGLRQSSEIAETRSVLLAAFALIYMVIFGHGLPGSVNRHLRM